MREVDNKIIRNLGNKILLDSRKLDNIIVLDVRKLDNKSVRR